MSLFIDTSKITDREELINSIRKNIKISRRLQKEISEMEAIDKSNKSFEFTNTITEQDINNLGNEKEEDIESDFYSYYYDPIKNIDQNISVEELKTIIKENLPVKSNPNYKKIVSRIKAEIYKELILLYDILNDSIDDESLTEETNKLIALETNKFNIINNIEEEEIDEEAIIDNKLFFLKTSSGNISASDDLDKIDKEYYKSFRELFISIKNGTFKNVKRLTSINNKLSSIAEVRGYKTRIIFDRINEDSYVILMCIIKKCNFDNGYRKSLERRSLIYRTFKNKIISKSKEEEYLEENKKYEKKLFLKLEKESR